MKTNDKPKEQMKEDGTGGRDTGLHERELNLEE